jgi:hypothetical protein
MKQTSSKVPKLVYLATSFSHAYTSYFCMTTFQTCKFSYRNPQKRLKYVCIFMNYKAPTITTSSMCHFHSCGSTFAQQSPTLSICPFLNLIYPHPVCSSPFYISLNLVCRSCAWSAPGSSSTYIHFISFWYPMLIQTFHMSIYLSLLV